MNSPSKNPSKNERRKEILDAAFQEFAEKGYAGTSMQAIARRARASKETLYAWFSNKETLFNGVFAARLDGLTSRVRPAMETDPSPSHVLPVIAEDVVRFNFAIAPLFRAPGGRQEGVQRVGKTIRDNRQTFIDYIAWCRDEGYIAFDDEPAEIASLFVAMASGELGIRLDTGMLDQLTDGTIQQHARRVSRIFLRGLAPEKPRAL